MVLYAYRLRAPMRHWTLGGVKGVTAGFGKECCHGPQVLSWCGGEALMSDAIASLDMKRPKERFMTGRGERH